MKVELIPIGNSRGIRIPKPLIEQCCFGDTVQIHVEQCRLIIEPDQTPRQGWKQAFAASGSSAQDRPLLKGVPANQFDAEGWTW